MPNKSLTTWDRIQAWHVRLIAVIVIILTIIFLFDFVRLTDLLENSFVLLLIILFLIAVFASWMACFIDLLLRDIKRKKAFLWLFLSLFLGALFPAAYIHFVLLKIDIENKQRRGLSPLFFVLTWIMTYITLTIFIAWIFNQQR